MKEYEDLLPAFPNQSIRPSSDFLKKSHETGTQRRLIREPHLIIAPPPPPVKDFSRWQTCSTRNRYLKGENKRKKRMPTTVNSPEWERPTNKSKERTKSSATLPCSMRTTGILPPLRCPSTSRNQNYPPAENQRRPPDSISVLPGGHDLRRHQAGLRQATMCSRAAYHHEPVATDYKGRRRTHLRKYRAWHSACPAPHNW